MDRQTLIARKHEVRRQLERTHRELEQLSTQPLTWRTRRWVRALQRTVERLMAEEYSLRLAIDRAGTL